MKNKGAAAIIATILLVMMAITAAGMAYTWTMNMQREIQKSTEDKYASDAAKADAKMTIPSMWNNAGMIDFILQNTGTYTFELTKFTIYSDGMPVTGAITYSIGAILKPGDITTVSLTTITFPIYPATPSRTIKVVADTGTSYTYRCEITSASQSYC
ncbi:MAG: archaellin/type IV pilin N-terminal domain-containing protein [Nanoarchaeota archaeon]|nr:hypothetical protein [Nanoarchaeota archaeon]MBU4451323.1 hypothetical protein [Nanoarchaeota archaeon]MCG2723284.1 hypothetical protein [archaeon]